MNPVDLMEFIRNAVNAVHPQNVEVINEQNQDQPEIEQELGAVIEENDVMILIALRDSGEKIGACQQCGKWIFPVLYALLRTKSAAVYTQMFRMIKDLWPQFSPTSISMDFEQAAIQASIEVFPGTLISGCLFHLVKNFKKQIGAAGLDTHYKDPEFAVKSRMIISLAFVPHNDVSNCFRRLRDHLMEYYQDLAPVLDWFEKNYVGTARRTAMFPVQWWTCYERTRSGKTGPTILLKPHIDVYKMLWVWIIQLSVAFFKISS
uniref:MULE transposase domain-containing protein n=1 Tax=Ditylenchus dipsaci TaxID=166011 RepID=A0A915DTF0_9BILA